MEGSEDYVKIWVTDFFHAFPHINKHIKRVSSKFDPEESDYIESLIFWALIPVACCLVLWIFYFFYFICRCCQKPSTPKKNPSLCPRLTTGLSIFFILGLLSFGLYENEEAHRGVDTFRNNLVEINRTVGTAVDRINSLDVMVGDVHGKLTDSIIQALDHLQNSTLEKDLEKILTDIQGQAGSALNQIGKIDLTNVFEAVSNIVTNSRDVEYYRWLGSVVIHCMFIAIIFFTLIGLLIRSRSILIVSTTVCVLSSIFLWAFSGTHLGSSVGLGDLCTDPNSFIVGLVDSPPEKAVLRAYVECKNNTEPYGDEIQTAIKSLNQALVTFDSFAKLLEPFHIKDIDVPVIEMKLDLQFSANNLSILLDNVGICDNLHSYYENCLHGACKQTITATAWMSLTGCLAGVLSVIIILSNSMLWRQYAKKRIPTNYGQVDDTDPFLPRPPPYDSDYGAVGYSSPTPWSERGTLQQQNTRLDSPYSDESLMMLPNTQRHSAPLPVDSSPPPAYHPGRFVRQYADSSTR